MLNLRKIGRKVINVVKNNTDAQVKVRKATSNDPRGPSSTLMSEIADLTYNEVAFSEILQIAWKRLNDHGKNWRHVYKALVLLEYLIKTGSEKVAQQCRDNLFAIQTLKDFQYFEDDKDQGLSIREKSKLLVALLKDEEKLKTERIRALKAKERFAQSQSAIDGGSLEIGGSGAEGLLQTSTSYQELLSSSDDDDDSVAQEECLRKNDDLRLKLALEESEKGKALAAAELAASAQAPRSAMDDLLSLEPSSSSTVACDPWGLPLNGGSNQNGLGLVASSSAASSAFLPSPPSNYSRADGSGQLQPSRQLVDPWGAPVVPSSTSAFEASTSSTAAFDDFWAGGSGGGGGRPNSISVLNDPWGGRPTASSTSPAANDHWNLNNGGADGKTTDFLGDLMEPSSRVPNGSETAFRRTLESFVGPNSNLVNLDALVSKTQTSTSLNSSNPFAAALPPPSNPFNLGKPSPPSMNQLRAAQTTFGGSQQAMPTAAAAAASSYSNASALSLLFSSPFQQALSNTSPLMVMGLGQQQQHPTTLSLVWQPPPQAFSWGSIGQSQQQATSLSANNPFAM